ncbi:Hypothetical predicted protein [Olea europaea subsp. europaea]|uniref:Uncharacterized protein n=1 Tax=Olea europaea subsp. europaea TaxID=158383 RepID=A0A8S0R718_OLEEU|nr:Hypothetical predicted protein [Olea europaea subsp. europaea]
MLFGVDVMATMMVGDLQVRRRVGMNFVGLIFVVADGKVTVVSRSAVAAVVAIFDECNAGEDELLWCGDGVLVVDSFLLPIGLITGWGGVGWGR